MIKGECIEIVDTWKYLGFNIQSGKQFSFSAQPELMSFYSASNCIINVLYKPSEEVLMKLLYSNCVSILTYGCQVKEFLTRDMSKMNVAINDSVRKIFGWQRWESVRTLRESMGYRSIYEIFEWQKRSFLMNTYLSDNEVLQRLIVLFYPTVINV